jgi:RND family efflux transporter MFP subunit
MKRNRVITLLVVLLTLAVSACSHREERPIARGLVAVSVAPVLTERASPPITGTGSLGLKDEVPLSFKVGGVVSRVFVDEGQVVHQGQTLATLEMEEIGAAVDRARSAAEKADRDLARARRLYADSVVTLEQEQNAETGREVAAADLKTATFNWQHATIVAPAPGIVLHRTVDPGQIVQAGAPVLVLGSRSRGSVVRIGLADRDAIRVHHADPAVVRFAALPGREFDGHVTQIAAAADPATGTFDVEVTIASTTALASGLVGQVEIRPVGDRSLAIIPVESLLDADGTNATVFALSADRRQALRRSVVVAFLDGDRAAIASGLDGVREVVTDGVASLQNGDAVRIVH